MDVQDTRHLLEELRRRRRDGDQGALGALLAETHAADLAGALRELDLSDKGPVARSLSREEAGAVLYEMDEGSRRVLVEALDQGEVSRILDQMPPDEAADVVESLPEEEAARIPHQMPPADAEEIQELLQYGESTAGGIMTPEYIAVHEEMTVGEALDHVRKSVTREGVFYVYVVDNHDHLVGLVPLRRLITADPATPVHAIRRTDVVSVTADTDQEDVARLATKHHLLAVPVVDRNNRLLGTVPIDAED